MGDIGDGDVAMPILPPSSEPLNRSKTSDALHIEDRTSLVQEVGDRLRNSATKDILVEVSPADSPMAISHAPSSLKSKDDEDESDVDLERDREPLTQYNTRDSNLPSRAPSPIRTYFDEPKLWRPDGPGTGKAVAQWKEKFVPVLHSHTAKMSPEERSNFFDELVEDDKDRYLPPLAAYYFEHRDQIPNRKPSDRAQKKIELGFRDNPRIRVRQDNVFKGWDWAKKHPVIDVEEPVGPKNETVPSEIEECEHCIKEAKKSQLRKRTSTLVGKITGRRRATVQVVDPEKEVEATKTQLPEKTASADAIDDRSLAESSSDAKSGASRLDHQELSTRLRKEQDAA